MEKLEVWDEAKLKLQFPGRVFVNTQEGHYKFWTAQIVSDHEYVVYWGRIGKAIQTATIAGNETTVREVIRQKIKKGYREI